MPHVRRRRTTALIVLLAALLAIGRVAVEAPSAAAAAANSCPPNSDAIGTELSERCVAEILRFVRGNIAHSCLVERRAILGTNPLYRRTDCKGTTTVQAEAIAQARFLAQLNDKAGDNLYNSIPAVGGISANAQWEVRNPAGKEIDVLFYDRSRESVDIELVELKVRRSSSSEPYAADQVERYQKALPRGAAQRDVELHDFGPNWPRDYFRFLYRDCDQPGATSRLVYYYDVQAVNPGVLMIDKQDKVTKCPGEGERALDAVPENEPRTEDIPENLKDDRTSRLPTPGKDRDGNGMDDFFDGFLEEHPELDDLRRQPVPPMAGDPLSVGDVLVPAAAAAAIAAIVVLCAYNCPALLASAVVVEAGAVSIGAAVAVLASLVASLGVWSIWGDPHIVTLDRLQYDLQSVGEFHLLELPEAGIDVQARFRASGPNISVLDRIATEIDDQRIEIGSTWATVDGQDVNLAPGGARVVGDGAVLARDAKGYSLVWPGGLSQPMALMTRANSVGVFLPPGTAAGSPRGLLGNHDGDPNNDLALRDGTPLPAGASSATLHGAFADSWRVSDDESLFSYAAGQSTATFTDRSAPANVVTTGDFSGAEVEAATATCSQAGVEPGPQFDACVLDVLVTGDSSYADAAALVTDIIVSANSTNFDGAGAIAVDFEGSVPPNFVASRYSADGATSRIGGPLFDTGGYRFYVRDVGRHDNLSLGADIYAFGPVADDAQPQSLALTVNKQPQGSILFDGGEPRLSAGMAGTVVRTGSGVTAAGQPFMRLRLHLPLGPVGESLDVELTPKNFSGVFNTSVGIDNITLALDVPPAQRFTTAEPLSVPGGPGSGLQTSDGAGVLESPGASDVYEFDVPAGQAAKAHVVNTPSCTTPMTYTMTNRDSGAPVGRWPNTCARITTPTLPAGRYVLAVTPYASGAAGSYSLELFVLPEPQRFGYSIASTVSNGVPASGAGNIETVASQDIYGFSFSGGEMYLDHRSCFAGERWELRPQGTGTALGRGSCGDARLTGLAAGDYELTVTSTGTGGGTYALQMFATPVAPQDFTTPLPLTVADQSPASGAGNLETKQSVDRYWFTVATSAPLYIDSQACLDDGSLMWKLVNSSSGSVVDSGGCTDSQTAPLPAGDYRLEIASFVDGVGPYALQAWLVPVAPQSFPVTLPAIVAPDRPVVGAGNLETKASQDTYSFTLPEGRNALYVDQVTCSKPDMLTWRLVNDVNANAVTVANGSCRDQQIRQVARGDYRLVVSPLGENHGTYSLRIVASDTGSPTIVHMPQTTAFNGRPIPIDASTTCQRLSGCFARLYYRTSSSTATAGAAGLAAGSWTAQDLSPAGTTTGAGSPLASWKGVIPATAVTTTGIDYYLAAGDGDNRNELPTAPPVPLGLTGTAAAIGADGTAYLHVTTLSPPLPAHVSPVYAQADTDLALELRASCSTGSCTARLHYRTSTGLGLGDADLVSDPGWPTIVMTRSASTPLGDAGSLVTWSATIPASKIDTRGLDYYFDIADTYTTSYWPGTTYQGYYAPRDGMRTAYQTIHVLEPPHIAHVPVATTPYRAATQIGAIANCPATRTCTARLYYRTTTNTGDYVADSVLTAQEFTEVAMSVTRVVTLLGHDIVNLAGTIPAAAADTRGIDYFFRVDDTSTTTWFPGTGQSQGYVSLDGARVAYQHVRVLEPPHVTPMPVPTTKALEPYTVTAAMTCATEQCSMTLHWRNDLSVVNSGTGWRQVPMVRTGLPVATPLGNRYTYAFTLPADQVTTRGLAYYLEGFDGYVHDYSPGTSYWGAYVPLDGYPIDGSTTRPDGTTRVVASFLVRVLEPPHLVHAPPGVVEKGQPLALTATSNCSSGSCPATLTWTDNAGQRRTVAMAAVRQLAGGAVNPAVPGDLWRYSATIPASDTTATVNYSMAITDGYTGDATPALQALVYERPTPP